MIPKECIMKKNPHPKHPCYRYNEALLFPLKDVFPKMLFLENLDKQWVHLFHNLYEQDHISRWKKNLNNKKLEVLLKSSLDYLDHHEREAVFVYHLKMFFKDIRNDNIGLKEIVSRSKKILTIAEQWEKMSSKESPLRSLGQSYLLFILTLNNSAYSPAHQKKILDLAYAYALSAQLKIKKPNHPYFNLLFCLIHIASNRWNEGTKELHSLASKYPDRQLYSILVKLYLKIGLPNVSRYFKNKRDHFFTGADSLALNSDFRSFSNLA